MSTIDDYARFARCLLRRGRSADGQRQIFHPDSVDLLNHNHLPHDGRLDTFSYDPKNFTFSETSAAAASSGTRIHHRHQTYFLNAKVSVR